ncbi:MAG: hypothetical protein L3J65_07430 [Robiginitomaculum sp.]|nr:hypothetical protein [Robiginitomaculum sp.]
MSYFKYRKRKTTLKSILLLLGLTVIASALMTSQAFADPQKKVDDAVETIEETAKDAAKDKMKAPMELPQVDEGTDGVMKTNPPVINAPEVPEIAVPEATKEPSIDTTMEAPGTKEPAEFSTTIPGIAAPTLDLAQSCYKQENGVMECICEGDKACADLTNSDICEPGTNWRNVKGFGGCTKKAE